MSRTPPIAIGDRFARVGQPDKVFAVTALRDKPGVPPHVELRLQGDGGPIQLGLSPVLDCSLYRRVQP